jgi:uncharacterized protein (DUF2141 family)
MEIHLTIQETSNDFGKVQVLLFNNKDGFPSDPSKAIKKLSLALSNKTAKITLEEIESGTYAIAVFHDEDGDGKMDKNSLGYPLNKFGFSNNPSILFGAPSFEKAAFEVSSKPVEINIKLR